MRRYWGHAPTGMEPACVWWMRKRRKADKCSMALVRSGVWLPAEAACEPRVPASPCTLRVVCMCGSLRPQHSAGNARRVDEFVAGRACRHTRKECVCSGAPTCLLLLPAPLSLCCAPMNAATVFASWTMACVPCGGRRRGAARKALRCCACGAVVGGRRPGLDFVAHPGADLHLFLLVVYMQPQPWTVPDYAMLPTVLSCLLYSSHRTSTARPLAGPFPVNTVIGVGCC